MITNHPDNIIFFVECKKTTKRFSGTKPTNLTELKDLIFQKFPDVGEQRIQIKDADFQVLCDLEDVEQLYSGAKLIIEESMEIESRKVDDATMTQLQNEMEQLRKENFQLRNQIEQQQPTDQRIIPEGFHVRLSGIPFQVTNEEMKNFFSEQKVVEDGVWILREYLTTMSRGEALVTFATEADRDAALKKHRQNMGSRWVEVREAIEGDFKRYQKIVEGYRLLAYPTFHKRYMAKMQGFEWKHTEEDIEKFVHPIVPLKIHIIYTKRGKNSGNVYVELSDAKALEQVLGKKKEYVDERWIDIWEAEESKFKLDVAQMCGCEIKEEFAPGCRNLKMDGIRREAVDQDIAKFFRSVGVLPIRIHRKTTGENAFVEFLSEDECKIAMTKNNQHIRDRYVTLMPVTSEEVSRVVPQAVAPLGFHSRHLDRARHSSYRPGRDRTNSSRYEPYEKPGKSYSGSYSSPNPPNATVKMIGLPYEVTKKEITQFWGGFNFIPDSIKILEKNGKSTGTGRITFESVEEATRAIEQKNNNYIGERYIALSYWKQFR